MHDSLNDLVHGVQVIRAKHPLDCCQQLTQDQTPEGALRHSPAQTKHHRFKRYRFVQLVGGYYPEEVNHIRPPLTTTLLPCILVYDAQQQSFQPLLMNPNS